MATFEWLAIAGPENRTSLVNSSFIRVSASTDSSTSQLQFRPLQQSHNGLFSCSAITDEDTLLSEPMEINVKGKKNFFDNNFICVHNYSLSSVPKMSIQITESTNGNVPIAGMPYDLICNALGAENLNPNITYQWTKNSDSSQIGTNSNILSFAPIRITDSGNYSCLVNVDSSYLAGHITAAMSHRVKIQSISLKVHIILYCVY